MKTKRLTEGGTDFEREVLASARLDQGPKGGLKRTLVALGVSAGAIPSSAASASAGVGLGAGATTGSGLASAAVVAKWLGVAILVAAGSGGAVMATSLVAPTNDSSPSSPQAVVQPTEPRAMSGTEVVERAPPAMSERPLLRAPEPVRSGPVMVAPPPTAVPKLAEHRPQKDVDTRQQEAVRRPPVAAPGDSSVAPAIDTSEPSDHATSLSAELALLDRARSALAERDAHTALAVLGAYEQSFPAGVLHDEAVVLRVDALTASGDRVGASRLARDFLASRPTSPHAPHLLQTLPGSPNL
jgi:hypothetical protein